MSKKVKLQCHQCKCEFEQYASMIGGRHGINFCCMPCMDIWRNTNPSTQKQKDILAFLQKADIAYIPVEISDILNIPSASTRRTLWKFKNLGWVKSKVINSYSSAYSITAKGRKIKV